MKQTVIFNVQLIIQDGKLAPFEDLAKVLVAATQKEPGTLGYEWHLSADRKRCRVIETYANPDAMMTHLSGPAVREFVPKLLETASIERFEVYGDPGPEGNKKLAGFGAEIFSHWHGLNR